MLDHFHSGAIYAPKQETRFCPRISRYFDISVSRCTICARPALFREVQCGDKAHEVEDVHKSRVDWKEGRAYGESYLEAAVW